MTIVWEHVRMNDYVGPGIFATVTWEQKCEKGGQHFLGRLTNTCSKCGAQATVKYDTEVKA